MKTIIILLSSALLFSCNPEKPEAPAADIAPKPSAALEKVLSTAPTGTAQGIAAARASLKPGDEVTLSGRIMGTKSPFVEGRAVFVLGDPELLTPCNENPGDNCETPWDTCCDCPEDKKRGTASIQIVCDDGRVLKEGIEGIGGIEKLAALTVSGKVAEGSNPDLLIVNATALQVRK